MIQHLCKRLLYNFISCFRKPRYVSKKQDGENYDESPLLEESSTDESYDIV